MTTARLHVKRRFNPYRSTTLDQTPDDLVAPFTRQCLISTPLSSNKRDLAKSQSTVSAQTPDDLIAPFARQCSLTKPPKSVSSSKRLHGPLTKSTLESGPSVETLDYALSRLSDFDLEAAFWQAGYITTLQDTLFNHHNSTFSSNPKLEMEIMSLLSQLGKNWPSLIETPSLHGYTRSPETIASECLMECIRRMSDLRGKLSVTSKNSDFARYLQLDIFWHKATVWPMHFIAGKDFVYLSRS